MVKRNLLQDEIPDLPSEFRFYGTYRQNGSLSDFLIGNKTFLFDPINGHRLNPSSAVLYYRKKRNRIEKFLRVVDRDGFVPNNLSSMPTHYRLEDARSSNKRTVFIFGGSTVAGNSGYLPDSEIAGQLESSLNSSSKSSNQYIVINAGVPAYGSDNQLRFLLHEILPLRPSIVVFYDGWNDASYLNGLITRYGDEYKQGRTRRSYSIMEHCSEALSIQRMAKHTIFLILFKLLDWFYPYIDNRIYDQIKSSVMHLTTAHLFDPPYSLYTFHEKSLAVYAHNIFCANALCQAYGVKFMHILQPLLATGQKPLTDFESQILSNQDSHEVQLYREFYNKFEAINHIGNQSLKDICMVSLRDIFINESREVYLDTGHLNSIGNSLIANSIAGKIIEIESRDIAR